MSLHDARIVAGMMAGVENLVVTHDTGQSTLKIKVVKQKVIN
jgi:hypothetical protein